MALKTKIIATVGPSSDNEKTFEEMVRAGVSAARINFSHSTHNDIKRRFIMSSKVLKKYYKNFILFGDIQGPKIRLGILKRRMLIKDNSILVISSQRGLEKNRVLIDYPDFYKHVKKGDKIFIDDGRVELLVEDVKDRNVICRVIVGGYISSRKGVNIINKTLPLSSLTQKDILDVKFAVSLGVKSFSLSFVRKKDDVLEFRKILSSINKDKYFIISKIEDRQGFEHIDEIISVSDGIMVARGDLGVSVNRSIVPLIQKEIIDKCNYVGIIDIVATQMLESMIINPYPTRAEVNDVAVAVMQGADYVMLSGETAIGNYPIKTVAEMKNIIDTVLSYMRKGKILF